MKRVHRCVAENRADGDKRVRIAILDSGIDATHKEIAGNIAFDVSPSSSEQQKRPRITAWKGFLSELDPLRDRVGHGTHCASVILRTAPYTSLYIARIFDDDQEISDCDQVVEVRSACRTVL